MTEYEERNAGGYGLRPAKRYRSARIANRAVLAPVTRAAVDREIRRINRRDADKYCAYVVISGNAVSYSGQITSVLGNLVHGDQSENQFAGESITPTGLTVRYQFDCSTTHGATAEPYDTCRLMVIQWNADGAGSSGGAAKYLNSTGNIMAPYSPKEWSNRKNFKVLADTGPVVFQTADDAVGGNGYMSSGVIYVPGKKMRKISFQSDATIQRGDIVVLCITDSAAAAHPNINWSSALTYTDV